MDDYSERQTTSNELGEFGSVVVVKKMQFIFLLVNSMEGIPFFGKCLLCTLLAVLFWRCCCSPLGMISTSAGFLLLCLGFLKKFGFSKEPPVRKKIAQGRRRRARVDQSEKIGLRERKRELTNLEKKSPDCDSGVESSTENSDEGGKSSARADAITDVAKDDGMNHMNPPANVQKNVLYKRVSKGNTKACVSAVVPRDDSTKEDEMEHVADDGKVKSVLDVPVIPEVPEPPKKSTRKQRKRKNPNKSKFKTMMDDSSETSSTSDLSTKGGDTPHPEKTVVYYTALPLYRELNLDKCALYHEFKQHLLTREQLRMYGFPEEAPGRPGRAILRTQSLVRGATERLCCRCGSTFNVLPDGDYVADSSCRYHARKQLPFRRGHPYRGDYPCCNGDYMSEGCVTWQYHVTAESALHDADFVQTRAKRHLRGDTDAACTVYALDCEMCYTTAGMEVAKIGIVGMDGLTVFESFVLPQSRILDYNTAYSGITERDLKGATMTLVDVQTYLLRLLNRESILVGHGLENDLKALRLIHGNIVDTSVVFPHPHTKLHKKSLKNLAREFLGKDIQQSPSGHNCIEDARTCMELMLKKIGQDLKDRPPVTQDENKNSMLQNVRLQPFELSSPPHRKYTPHIFQPWPSSYGCNYSHYSDSLRYTSYLSSKNYNNCIYG